MAERRTAGSRRSDLVPLLCVVASTLVTATVYLSLIGAPLVILSSIALGGVIDHRRSAGGSAPSRDTEGLRRAARRSILVWGLVATSSAVWLVAVAVAEWAVPGALLFALPALVLSVPALVGSIGLARGKAVPSWPFVAGWALIVISLVFGALATGSLFVDDRRPGLAASGAAMVVWSVSAAVANVRVSRR